LRAVPSRRTPLQLPVSCGRTRSGAMQINRNTPAVAHRQAGALLRRYAVQCRRRELPQRRPSGGTVQDVRRAACQAAIIDLDLPRATTTSKTICVSRWIASPTTRRRARCSTSSPGKDPDKAYVSTLEVEGEINTFFRLGSRRSSRSCASPSPTCPTSPTGARCS
jgi:hypothetical protein